MLLKGLFFGFVLAAVVGAMWVLCSRRTIEHGSAAGLASGLGIAALRARLSMRLLRGINLVSGVTILGFAVWQLAALLR